MLNTESIEESFLRKLLGKGKIGGDYMPEKYVLRRMKDWSPKEQKLAKKVWEDLIKDGLVLLHPGKTERVVSLNPRKRKEIMGKLP